MKKMVIILFAFLLLTGCSVENIKNVEQSEIVDIIVASSKFDSNVNRVGYSFYKPHQLSIVSATGYNTVFRFRDDNIHMYVDLVGFYNNAEVVIDPSYEKALVFKKIEFDDKVGYLLVEKKDGKFSISLYYNYAIASVITDDSNYSDLLMNMAYLVSNVKYNNETLQYLFANEQVHGDIIMFSLFENEEIVEDNFLDYNPQKEGNY